MATKLYFSRDTKVYAHVPMSSATTKNMYFELPVLDGFSFSQAMNTSEITLNEAQDTSGVSRRGRSMFNDSFAPVEWSFSTYMSPFTHNAAGTIDGVTIGSSIGTTGAAHATDNTVCEVSSALWAMFFGQTVDAGLTEGTTNLAIVQSGANKATIGVFDLYFVLGASQASNRNYQIGATASSQLIYKIEGCSINEASFDFDLDGIATVNWSGNGKIITDTGANFNRQGQTDTVYEGVANTTGFIRNRVSDLTITGDPSGSTITYATTLTGGNITMSNNLTYLTPETLGVVNQPLGHVTGSKSIGGNFTCYLDSQSGNPSAELYEDLVEATTDIQNSFSLTFDIGASVAPYCKIEMPRCHLEVPTHSIEEVISMETNFHALPQDFDETNEITDFLFYGKDVNA